MKLPVLAQIAKEAGEEIALMQRRIANNPEQISRKSDGTEVTTADMKANGLIISRLQHAFPSLPIVSEENSSAQNFSGLHAAEKFIIDPLDNTSEYIQGKDGYSVNIGHVKDGVPIAGAVYFPGRKELYYTDDDGNACYQKDSVEPVQIHAKGLPLRSPLQVAAGGTENLEYLGKQAFDIKKYSGQYRTCMVATGDCDLTWLNKGAREGYSCWDTAGPHAVLLAAGGEMVTLDRKPMRYGQDVTMPPHITGSKDALIALGLANKEK